MAEEKHQIQTQSQTQVDAQSTTTTITVAAATAAAVAATNNAAETNNKHVNNNNSKSTNLTDSQQQQQQLNQKVKGGATYNTQSSYLHVDAGTSDDSGRASERLTNSSIAHRDTESSRDRMSDVSKKTK